MESLVNALLSNALVATGLALAPLVLSRFGRSPALVHSLWLIVLLKLVTPPFVQVPLAISSAPAPSALNLPEAEMRELHQDPGSAERFQQPIPDGLKSLTEDRSNQAEERAVMETHHQINPSATMPRGLMTLQAFPPWHLAFLAMVVTGALVFWSLAAVRIVRLHRLLGDLRPAPIDVQSQVHTVAR